MVSKSKKAFLLLMYYISPIIASIIYWFEEPKPFILTSNDLLMNLTHRAGSILGIFAFTWMCFNIIIAIKFKMMEENFSLEGVLRFHTTMAAIALLFSIVHYPLSRLGRTLPTTLMRTGTIGFTIFFGLMVLAFIFMTNRLIKRKRIVYLRAFSYKIKFKYNINKALHNLMMLGVITIFFHAFLSITSESSILMRGVYFFFTTIALIGWIYHKLIRRFRSESDPYAYRKAPWDVVISEIIQERNNKWALGVILRNPSLFPCLQCGSCTATCVVADITEGDFNPRKIMENLLLGSRDKILIDKKPNIWDCSHCHSCDEICPQHVRLADIFIFLRNKITEQTEAPDGYLSEAEVVYNFGVSIPLQSEIIRRREMLKLPPLPEFDIQEIQDIMDMTGLNTLVEKSEVEEKREVI